MELNKLRISICICTYKRPYLLNKLLLSLFEQKNPKLYEFNVIVVDNDFERSAKKVVDFVRTISPVEIKYFNEPNKNISLARNMAIKNADGDLLAFLDDDELPDNLWLTNLVKCYLTHDCDGVLGPIIPKFSVHPPTWVLQAKLFDRPNPLSGTTISEKDMRTGNVLLNRNLFKALPNPFSPDLGLTGGEDVEFFEKMTKYGYKFIWCQEAKVFEIISIERFSLRYHLKKAIRRGKARATINPFFSLSTCKSFLAILIYLFILPFTIFMGFGTFNKHLISFFDHGSKLFFYLKNFKNLKLLYPFLILHTNKFIFLNKFLSF